MKKQYDQQYHCHQRETAITTISPAIASRMNPAEMQVMSLCLVLVRLMKGRFIIFTSETVWTHRM